jgi:hypothetical protein
MNYLLGTVGYDAHCLHVTHRRSIAVNPDNMRCCEENFDITSGGGKKYAVHVQ